MTGGLNAADRLLTRPRPEGISPGSKCWIPQPDGVSFKHDKIHIIEFKITGLGQDRRSGVQPAECAVRFKLVQGRGSQAYLALRATVMHVVQ
jgi:hypothetical protein